MGILGQETEKVSNLHEQKEKAMKAKSEWCYLSANLIFGPHKLKSKEMSIYSLDTFRKYKDLNVVQVSAIDTITRRIDTKRNFKIRPHISLIGSHIQQSSEIAKILTYENSTARLHVSDAIFSDLEFEITGYDWEKMVDTRIQRLAVLIQALYDQDMEEIPLLINEFPNISNVLLKGEKYWR